MCTKLQQEVHVYWSYETMKHYVKTYQYPSSSNTWKAYVAKSEPVIASYASWLAQHAVLTPLFCELQRWAWSTVPRNTPPQLGAAAPTPYS